MTTATPINRISPYLPPEVPHTPEQRQDIWADAIFAAVQFYMAQLRHPDAAVSERAARAILDLEKTRLRHGRDLAGTTVEPPPREPLLPPLEECLKSTPWSEDDEEEYEDEFDDETDCEEETEQAFADEPTNLTDLTSTLQQPLKCQMMLAECKEYLDDARYPLCEEDIRLVQKLLQLKYQRLPKFTNDSGRMIPHPVVVR